MVTEKSIEIVEVGPRDGLQNEPTLLSVADKVRYIRALVDAGHRRIEAVSFVHAAKVPQMADAEEVMAQVPRIAGVTYAGLVLNQRGLDRALDAGMDEVNVVLPATDTFADRNQGMDVKECLRMVGTVVAGARGAGVRTTVTIGLAFGCPFEGEVTAARVAELVRWTAAIGPNEICLADTIGVGVPIDVDQRVDAVREVTDLPLRFHFHNTRNTGYANAIAAVAAGASSLDSSSGGIGGCPFAQHATGNIATEDLCYLLDRSGVTTQLRLGSLFKPSAMVAQLLDKQLPALLPLVGGFPGAPGVAR